MSSKASEDTDAWSNQNGLDLNEIIASGAAIVWTQSGVNVQIVNRSISHERVASCSHDAYLKGMTLSFIRN